MSDIQDVKEKPDISFGTPERMIFPTPQEFEERMIKTGHFTTEGRKLTAGEVVLSVISILGACAILFFAGRHFVGMSVNESVSTRYASDIAGKLGQLYADLVDDIASSDAARILRSVGIWLGLALSGLLAGSMDILLGRLPLDRRITGRFSFDISPLTRYLPSMLCTAYLIFTFAAYKFDNGLSFTVNAMNFSLTGEGYDWCRWVTQGFYILMILAVLFLAVEAFSNSGLFGMMIRLPLALMSNTAVITILLLSYVCPFAAAVIFILIKITGIVIKSQDPDNIRYYRTYN